MKKQTFSLFKDRSGIGAVSIIAFAASVFCIYLLLDSMQFYKVGLPSEQKLKVVTDAYKAFHELDASIQDDPLFMMNRTVAGSLTAAEIAAILQPRIAEFDFEISSFAWKGWNPGSNYPSYPAPPAVLTISPPQLAGFEHITFTIVLAHDVLGTKNYFNFKSYLIGRLAISNPGAPGGVPVGSNFGVMRTLFNPPYYDGFAKEGSAQALALYIGMTCAYTNGIGDCLAPGTGPVPALNITSAYFWHFCGSILAEPWCINNALTNSNNTFFYRTVPQFTLLNLFVTCTAHHGPDCLNNPSDYPP